jgi:DNA-directed RNA polymerase specialized sigma24 family protein
MIKILKPENVVPRPFRVFASPCKSGSQRFKLSKMGLTLNLIATQTAKQQSPLDDLLRRIEQGTAPEVEDRILSEIWGMLKVEHQQVLRVLAELPERVELLTVALPMARWQELGVRLTVSEGAARVAAHRFRKRYQELLRTEIGRTVAHPGEVEDEVRYLLQVLN